MTWVWLDGRFVPESKALVPATDPAFLYGHGLFETLRTYGGAPFRLEHHLERMRRSARRLGLMRVRASRLDPVIRGLCRRNRVEDATVRITASAGGHLLVLARKRRPLPRSWYSRGARIRLAPWRRDPRAPLAGHKTLSYWEHVRAHEEALRAGCADTVYLGPRGEILEGAVTNIFLVFGTKIVTPSLRQGILPGVTRRAVMELARVTERAVYRDDLRRADEVFLTNALIEVLPVGRPGRVTRMIAERYRALAASCR